MYSQAEGLNTLEHASSSPSRSRVRRQSSTLPSPSNACPDTHVVALGPSVGAREWWVLGALERAFPYERVPLRHGRKHHIPAASYPRRHPCMSLPTSLDRHTKYTADEMYTGRLPSTHSVGGVVGWLGLSRCWVHRSATHPLSLSATPANVNVQAI